MSFDWKKAGLWTGGIIGALLVGYALIKYEENTAATNAAAAANQTAQDDELAQSFAPTVGSGSGSVASTGTVDSGEDTSGSDTSSAVDPVIAAILAAYANNTAASSSNSSNTSTSGSITPPNTPGVGGSSSGVGLLGGGSGPVGVYHMPTGTPVQSGGGNPPATPGSGGPVTVAGTVTSTGTTLQSHPVAGSSAGLKSLKNYVPVSVDT